MLDSYDDWVNALYDAIDDDTLQDPFLVDPPLFDGDIEITDIDLMRCHYAKLAIGKRGYAFCEKCGCSTRVVLDGETYCDYCQRYQ